MTNLSPKRDQATEWPTLEAAHRDLESVRKRYAPDLHVDDWITLSRAGEVLEVLIEILRSRRPRGESALQRPEVGSTVGLGCCLITAERRRQIEKEGWSVEHDNGHDKGELAMAGAAYAHHATYGGPRDLWPWANKWWKPGVGRTLDTRIRALAKAGALIAAEIDRLERLRIGDGAQHPNEALNDSGPSTGALPQNEVGGKA